jgi:tetratricopeptide (TPR) repeat protein
MKRVLESRQHEMETRNEVVPHLKLDRNQRPKILASDIDGAERVHGLLNVLCQRGLVTEESYQIVMRAYVNRGRLRWRPSPASRRAMQDGKIGGTNETTTLLNRKVICAADQVEALFQEMLERFPANTISIETYNLVLEAYANCATPRGGERNFARRAQILLERMASLFGEVPLESLMHVLHATAWQQANLQPGIYAEQANRYLEVISNRTEDPKRLLQALSWTLEAYSKSGSAGSAPKAESLLTRMIEVNATIADCNEYVGILDAEDFSNAILAWSKSNDSDAAEQAQKWLKRMLSLYSKGAFPPYSEPPLIAFNSVIVAWSRRGDYGRAAEVLWLIDKVSNFCQNLVPHVVSYNSVLHAYFRAKAPLDKVLSLVKFMHDNCDSQPAIRPNSFTYYTFLKCLLQSRDADPENVDILEECEDSLGRLEACWLKGDFEMKPTNRIFNMVINAYAKSNDKRAWRKATNILDRMKKISSFSEELIAVEPDIITVTSVIECLSKASDPQVAQLAQSLLQESMDEYHKTQNLKDRPNLRTYTMAILTLSKNHGSVQDARKLLDDLIELYEATGDASLKPNAYPYNYVLNCAASSVSDDPGSAFKIATRTFQELRKAGLADSYSYAFWIKCCSILVKSEDLKKKCVAYAFEECKRDGLLTSEVLNRFFRALPRAVVLNELLEGKVDLTSKADSSPYTAISVDELPSSWSRKSRKRK